MQILWTDRKRTFLGRPLSFTKYTLDAERLFIKTGALNLREDEIRLYRIKDITLHQTLGQRILGIGTIHCCSTDSSLKEFDIKNVKKPRVIRELLSQAIEEERQKKRVRSLETMDADGDDTDGDGIPDAHDDDAE